MSIAFVCSITCDWSLQAFSQPLLSLQSFSCHLSHLPSLQSLSAASIYSSQSCWDRQLWVQGCSTWELWWNKLGTPAPDPGGCLDSGAGTGQMENDPTFPLSHRCSYTAQQIITSDKHNSYCCLLCSLGKKITQLLISTQVGTSRGWQISRFGQGKDQSPCLILKKLSLGWFNFPFFYSTLQFYVFIFSLILYF